MFSHTCVGGGSELRQTYFLPSSCLGCNYCVVRAFVFGLPISSISLDNMRHMPTGASVRIALALTGGVGQSCEHVPSEHVQRWDSHLPRLFSLFPCSGGLMGW